MPSRRFCRIQGRHASGLGLGDIIVNNEVRHTNEPATNFTSRPRDHAVDAGPRVHPNLQACASCLSSEPVAMLTPRAIRCYHLLAVFFWAVPWSVHVAVRAATRTHIQTIGLPAVRTSGRRAALHHTDATARDIRRTVSTVVRGCHRTDPRS